MRDRLFAEMDVDDPYELISGDKSISIMDGYASIVHAVEEGARLPGLRNGGLSDTFISIVDCEVERLSSLGYTASDMNHPERHIRREPFCNEKYGYRLIALTMEFSSVTRHRVIRRRIARPRVALPVVIKTTRLRIPSPRANGSCGIITRRLSFE